MSRIIQGVKITGNVKTNINMFKKEAQGVRFMWKFHEDFSGKYFGKFVGKLFGVDI